MVWSGKNHYENLDDALQDLEEGLGRILVGLALGAEPSARRKSTPNPSRPKKTQVRHRKASFEEPVPMQVLKLEEIAKAIRGKEDAQVTRLTVIKKLCENPEAAGAFAMFLARKAQGRLREKQGKERFAQLADRAVSEMKGYLNDPTEDSKKQLRSLLLEIEAEQNECVSIKWSAVPNIKSWDLLIVENTLRSILNLDEAPRWLYQAARDYVGGSIEFDKKSTPQLEAIAGFWRRHFTIKR
jgi:hypothetical protein